MKLKIGGINNIAGLSNMEGLLFWCVHQEDLLSECKQ
jgi:hypothetical protein